ncbi:MAG: hypothetical protein ACHQX3_04630 [Nitrospirales bacterium]|jgi:hypothetical protein
MEERINCSYCKRRNVVAAETTSDIVFRDASKPPIVFTSSGMCADCAKMAGLGASRGLKAFYDEIQRLRKVSKHAPKPTSWDEINKEVDQFLRTLGLQS